MTTIRSVRGNWVNGGVRAFSVLGLLGLAVLPAYAFRSEDGKLPAKEAALNQQKATVPRGLTGGQLSATETGGKLGVKVVWNSRAGTPSSIRGADLGQRQAFSGGKGLLLRGSGAYRENAVAVLDNLAGFFRFRDAEKEFAVKAVEPDSLGFHHVKLSQTHQGLKVVGGELAVHFNKAGQAYEVNGRYVPDINVGVVPALSADEAVRLAQADLSGKGRPAGALANGPELVVFARDMAPQLAYAITLSYQDQQAGPGRWRYWIDGLRGEILSCYNDIQRVAPPSGNGTNSVVTGSVLLGEGGQATNVLAWFETGGNHYLYSKVRNWCVYNVATNGYPDFGTYAYRATGNWGTSDRAEISAARGFEQVQRYFSQVHGLSSFDGAGALARANVHEGVDYVNAFWDGSQFYFGDGDAVYANSLAVLDIAGHEFTHAVTEYSSNLIYMNESGALNESFSDIFGTCIEFFSQADDRASYPSRHAGQADWLCGEDSWLASTALRDLRNPANPLTVGAGSAQPTRYKGTYWDPYQEVHQNSGVQNFFFYLLCEGGSGNNDGIAYNVTGIGVTNAERVAFRALTVYCTPDTDYRAARRAWLSAAEDLNPAWVGPVGAAWDAVGVQAVYVTPESGVSFSGLEGGPFSPATFTFKIWNDNETATGWGVRHTQAWVNVAPESGSLPAFGSQTVTVTLSGVAAGMTVGTFTDTLVFTNTATAASDSRTVTLQVKPPTIYSFNLDANPGWTTEGQWAYGMPLGLGGDPSSGATGTKVYGYNLSGAYSNSMPICALTTPAIDCAAYGSLQLSFQRWLGVEDSMFDHATIQVSTNGTAWSNVWDHDGSTISDTSWTNCVYSLPTATGQRTVYLRWLMGPTDSSATYSGWNLDDIQILGLSRVGLRVLPGGELNARGYEGGPFSPGSATYSLINGGASAFLWTASTTSAWLSVSSSGGSLAAGATATVAVAFSPAASALPPGQYQGAVVFGNPSSGYSTTRLVSLTVLAIPGEIAVWDSLAPNSDTNLPFGQVIVGLSRTEQVRVSNTDPTYPLVITGIALGAYNEDFNDGQAQGWEEMTDEQWEVVEGEYRSQDLTASAEMQSVYAGKVWQDCSVSATLRRTGDTGGAQAVIVRASPDFRWVAPYAGFAYDIGISGEGYFYVAKTEGGAWAMIQPWTMSPFLNLGEAVNTILVNKRGSLLEVYFNGQLAWSGTDSSISGEGRAGLAALSAGIFGEALVSYFDDVTVGEALPATSAAVGAEQAWYNANAYAGAVSRSVPAGWQPPRYVGQDVQRGLAAGPVALSGASGGGFTLSGLPEFPYSLPPGADLTFDVVYTPAAVGAASGSVVIASNDADEPEFAVALTGEGIADYLVVQPQVGLSGSGHPGGPFTPASQTYTVSNRTLTVVNWSAASYPGWVTVTPASGSLPAGARASVLVAFNAAAAALPEGLYSDDLVFSNHTTTVTQVRPLALEVFTTPVVRVAPAAFTVTNRIGQTRQSLLQIGNAAWADASLNFSLGVSETARAPLQAALPPPPARDFSQVAKGADYRAGELLVRFSPAATGAARAQTLAAAGGGSVAREFRLVPGLTLVKLPVGTALADALLKFNQTTGILYAQPNYLHQAFRTPNDMLFDQLWGLHNDGQTGGTPDADIDAPEAWERGVGGESVIVAVIDTGVDYSHEDLVANMWRNPGEVPANGLDDDGNGYVDDIHGYDFYNGDADPLDDHDHGTHCAGTVGGLGDNGVGVAGVCWNVRIMALKFLSAEGSGSTADAISCFEYAVQMGARVLSNSWGGGPYEQALKDVIDAAGLADVLVVAAAGNDYGNNNDTLPSYPASYESENVISVMSVDASGAMSGFSNFGAMSVDLAAPGGDILSCMRGGGYQYMSGTSMATPHVSGACGLLLSLDSGLSYQAVKNALMSTTDASLPGLCVAGGLMKVAAALAANPGWLRVSPYEGGPVEPGEWSNVTVVMDAHTLGAGTYEGVIRIACNDRDTPVTNVPVTLVVLQDNLLVTPTEGMVAEGLTGGPFAPSSKLYTLTNAGAASLSWSVVGAAPWVSVTPGSGTIAAGKAVQVTVAFSAQAAQLSPGDYVNEVAFSNRASTAVQFRRLELTVFERVLDHFEWDWIEPAQYVGEPFGVTVTAIDNGGSVLSGFTGQVSLYAPSGAASEHTVVSGTTEWNYPLSTYYHDARTQVIYLSGELGGASLISGLSLYVSSLPGQNLNAWTIRLKHTPIAGYSSSAKRWETNDWVVALQTDANVASNGWVTFGFETPFLYNGTDNLLVDFSFNNTSYSTDGSCWSTQVLTNRSLYYRTDSGYDDPLTWTGTVPGGTITNRIPVIRIEKRGVLPLTPTATGNFVNGLWAGDVTVEAEASAISLMANDGSGHGGSSNPFDVLYHTIGLPEALDRETLTWTTGGSSVWIGQTAVTHDGVDAARSGALGNRQSSWLQTQVTGPGDASFWWRVSSEADWDWLEFYVDGVLADRITGESGWLRKVETLAAGTHTLKWRYVKDGADVDPVGQDCGWVDSLSGPSSSIVPADWLLLYGLPTDGSADHADSDHDGMSNEDEWVAGTVPTNGLSLLQMESVLPSSGAGGFQVRWHSAPGKRYWVGSCDSLRTYPIFFTPFVSNVLGQAGSTQVLDTRPSASGKRFYRVGVQVP